MELIIKDVDEFKESMMLQLQLHGLLMNNAGNREPFLSEWRIEEAKKAIDIVLQLELNERTS